VTTAVVDPQTLPAGDAIEDALDQAWHSWGQRVRHDERGRRLNCRYSRDIRAAMAFLQTWFAPFLGDYYSFTRLDGEWEVEIHGGYWRKDGSGDDYEVEGHADTLPLAICRAMLHIDREDEA
jgi:hypothetical protein